MSTKQLTRKEKQLICEYDQKIEDLNKKYQKVTDAMEIRLSMKDTIIDKLRRQNKQLSIRATVEEEMINIFHNSISTEPSINQSHFFCKEPTGKVYTEDAALFLSDLHLGERVISEEVDNTNHFSYDILTHRLKNLTKGISNIISNGLGGYYLPSITLALVGDLVTGSIHDELTETNEFVDADSMIVCQKLLSEYVLGLRKLFKTVNVVGVSGNHGRLTKNVRYKKAWNNWDYIIMKMVEDRLSGLPGINFKFPKATTQIFNIGKHTLYIDHGFGIRSWNGIPYYGLKKWANNIQTRLIKSKKVPIDTFVVGHFHQPGYFEEAGAGIFMNGSLIGPNEFSIKRLYSASEPSAWFMGFASDPVKRVTFRYKMNELSDQEERDRYWK